jgi:hypothetical protein
MMGKSMEKEHQRWFHMKICIPSRENYRIMMGIRDANPTRRSME